MNHANKFNSSTIDDKNITDKKDLFQVTTEQFRKYTTIEANRKIKPFFNSNSNLNKLSNEQSRTNQEKQLPSQTITSNRQTVFLQKYLPSRHFNPRLKSKKHQFNFMVNPSYPTINNTITIDDNSDNSDDESNTKEKRKVAKKFIKENRSFSLKSYLNEKLQQKFILPKIGKPQNIIEIVEKEFKLSKQRRKNPRLRNIHQITLNRQTQNQHSQLRKYQKSKSPSQRQIFKSVSSKQSLKPLLDFDYTSAYSKKKIELMGMKLKPVEREETKIGRNFENRTQRIGSLNLLPSQLIYKNPKESIQKSVYQQLMKRVFSSS